MEDLEGNCLLLLKLVDAAMTGLTLEFGLVETPVRIIPASISKPTPLTVFAIST
jgi:hypothetical protein